MFIQEFTQALSILTLANQHAALTLSDEQLLDHLKNQGAPVEEQNLESVAKIRANSHKAIDNFNKFTPLYVDHLLKTKAIAQVELDKLLGKLRGDIILNKYIQGQHDFIKLMGCQSIDQVIEKAEQSQL